MTTEKGRNAEKRKLTDLDAVLIRCAHIPASPEYGISALARLFGVSRLTVDRILSRATYRNLHPRAVPSFTAMNDEEIERAYGGPFHVAADATEYEWYGQTIRGTNREFQPTSSQEGDRRYRPLLAYRGVPYTETPHRLQTLSPKAEAKRRKNIGLGLRKSGYAGLVKRYGVDSENVARYLRYVERRDGTRRAEEIHGGPLPEAPTEMKHEISAAEAQALMDRLSGAVG